VKDWRKAALLIPHEPFRFYAQNIQQIVGTMKPEETWKFGLFYKWWNTWYNPYFHHHHRIEEVIFFPPLTARIKDTESVSEDATSKKVTADHRRLVELSDGIRGMEKQFANAEVKEILELRER